MKKILYPHSKYPHTQEIYFDNNSVRILSGVTSVEEGKWVHIICEDDHGGHETIVNPTKVLFIRIKYER
jgi:hypothetical protein